jgi:hypothetical protein
MLARGPDALGLQFRKQRSLHEFVGGGHLDAAGPGDLGGSAGRRADLPDDGPSGCCARRLRQRTDQHLDAGKCIVCRYSGAGGTAAVAIFAHQSPAIFGRQVVNAVGAPAMPKISGVGDGAYGQTIGGRSIVNAYSNAIRTVVAAQAPGSLGPVEALARVALADN